jgi:hypothetical protein
MFAAMRLASSRVSGFAAQIWTIEAWSVPPQIRAVALAGLSPLISDDCIMQCLLDIARFGDFLFDWCRHRHHLLYPLLRVIVNRLLHHCGPPARFAKLLRASSVSSARTSVTVRDWLSPFFIITFLIVLAGHAQIFAKLVQSGVNPSIDRRVKLALLQCTLP